MAENGRKKAEAAEQYKRQNLLSAPSSHLTLLAVRTGCFSISPNSTTPGLRKVKYLGNDIIYTTNQCSL